MIKTWEIAISKIAALPEAAREQLGREHLERFDALKNLRAQVEAGTDELDAGLGEDLDVEELLRQLHKEHPERAASARASA